MASAAFAISKVACPQCDRKISAYDYLSHVETCNTFPDRDEYYYADDESPLMGRCDISMDHHELDDELEYIELSKAGKFMPVSFPDSQMHYTPRQPNEPTPPITDQTTGKEMDQLVDMMQEVDIGLGVGNLWMYGTKTRVFNITYCVMCAGSYPRGSDFYYMKCQHAYCQRCAEKWFELHSLCGVCNTNMKHIA